MRLSKKYELLPSLLLYKKNAIAGKWRLRALNDAVGAARQESAAEIARAEGRGWGQSYR